MGGGGVGGLGLGSTGAIPPIAGPNEGIIRGIKGASGVGGMVPGVVVGGGGGGGIGSLLKGFNAQHPTPGEPPPQDPANDVLRRLSPVPRRGGGGGGGGMTVPLNYRF